MEEVEKFFKCPFCLERISMVLETTEELQTYIEDYEVCCNPIQISYRCENGRIKGFQADKAYG